MTKEEKAQRELFKRELNRFSHLQLQLHKLHKECETDQGLLMTVKLMDYISSEMSLIAKDIGNNERSDI